MSVSADPRILVRPTPPVPTPLPEMTWEPCGHCWGQRVIWHEDLLGLVPYACGGCGGTGVRLVLA